jgi:hypothetical protein
MTCRTPSSRRLTGSGSPICFGSSYLKKTGRPFSYQTSSGTEWFLRQVDLGFVLCRSLLVLIHQYHECLRVNYSTKSRERKAI